MTKIEQARDAATGPEFVEIEINGCKTQVRRDVWEQVQKSTGPEFPEAEIANEAVEQMKRGVCTDSAYIRGARKGWAKRGEVEEELAHDRLMKTLSGASLVNLDEPSAADLPRIFKAYKSERDLRLALEAENKRLREKLNE